MWGNDALEIVGGRNIHGFGLPAGVVERAEAADMEVGAGGDARWQVIGLRGADDLDGLVGEPLRDCGTKPTFS